MYDDLPESLLDEYRRRLGEAGFATRLAFENGESPTLSGAFRRRHLFGPLTPLITRSARIVLSVSGFGRWGHRQFHALRVVRNQAVIPRLPQPFRGFRILHLSDLHIDLDPVFSETLARTLAPLDYDLCVLTGDFRNHTYGPCAAAVAGMLDLLPRLRAPTYAVLGNHDRLSMIPPLEAAGCRFLLNEHVTLVCGDATLCLVGVDDPCVVGSRGLAHALRGAPSDTASILLAHSPVACQDAARHGMDYVFAGHTHGGQICLPGGFILFPNDPSPRAMHRGAWACGSTRGYTSPGTGACGIPARFNCPPEVTLHTLTDL